MTAVEMERAVRKGDFAPGYLLVGRELYFRDRLRAALLDAFAGGRREDVGEFDLAETPVRDALDDAASLGLFATRRLQWLRNAEALLPRRRAAATDDDDGEVQTAGKHSLEAIQAYFERPQSASLVIFEATTLDLADRDDLRKVERLEKLLPVPSVRLDRPSAAQASRYIEEEAKRAGFAIDDDAARQLADACAGDLARAAQELEKLTLYAAGRKRITSADVELLVSPESSFTLWEISDAIGERDTRRALELVGDMIRQDTPPLLLASLIASQVRKLIRVKEGNTREWVHPKIKTQAHKFTVAELANALEKLFEADIALRSSPPDERLVLEKLVIELSKKQPAARR